MICAWFTLQSRFQTLLAGDPEPHGELLGVSKAQAAIRGRVRSATVLSSKEALRDGSVRLLASGSGGIVKDNRGGLFKLICYSYIHFNSCILFVISVFTFSSAVSFATRAVRKAAFLTAHMQ